MICSGEYLRFAIAVPLHWNQIIHIPSGTNEGEPFHWLCRVVAQRFRQWLTAQESVVSSSIDRTRHSNQQQHARVDVLECVQARQVTTIQAATVLGVSERHLWRFTWPAIARVDKQQSSTANQGR